MSLGGKPAQHAQLRPSYLPQGFEQGQVDLLTSLLQPGGGGLEKFFGGLGSPSTGLQRQAGKGIEQFLNQPAPEQRAMDISLPALQNILGGKPGQGIIDALQPTFERNLASANQQGGRFGSGNAILRSRALEDFNLLGARAAETGINQQMQAAQALGLLSGQAGMNPFNRFLGAAESGRADAQQADLETQRRIQLLAGLLSSQQGLAFNQPWVQTKAASGGLGGFLGQLLGAGVGAFTGGLGTAAAGALGGKIFGNSVGQFGRSLYPDGMFGGG